MNEHYNMLTARGVDSHMKVTGMLVISFRDVNYGFRYRLGCSGWNADIFSH